MKKGGVVYYEFYYEKGRCGPHLKINGFYLIVEPRPLAPHLDELLQTLDHLALTSVCYQQDSLGILQAL